MDCKSLCRPQENVINNIWCVVQDGNTALPGSILFRHTDIMEYLVNQGANLVASNNVCARFDWHRFVLLFYYISFLMWRALGWCHARGNGRGRESDRYSGISGGRGRGCIGRNRISLDGEGMLMRIYCSFYCEYTVYAVEWVSGYTRACYAL